MFAFVFERGMCVRVRAYVRVREYVRVRKRGVRMRARVCVSSAVWRYCRTSSLIISE